MRGRGAGRGPVKANTGRPTRPSEDPLVHAHEDLAARILALYARRAATGVEGARVLALHLEVAALLDADPTVARNVREATALIERASAILDRIEAAASPDDATNRGQRRSA